MIVGYSSETDLILRAIALKNDIAVLDVGSHPVDPTTSDISVNTPIGNFPVPPTFMARSGTTPAFSTGNLSYIQSIRRAPASDLHPAVPR